MFFFLRIFMSNLFFKILKNKKNAENYEIINKKMKYFSKDFFKI